MNGPIRAGSLFPAVLLVASASCLEFEPTGTACQDVGDCLGGEACEAGTCVAPGGPDPDAASAPADVGRDVGGEGEGAAEGEGEGAAEGEGEGEGAAEGEGEGGGDGEGEGEGQEAVGPGELVVTEILVNAAGVDSSAEYVEVYNATGRQIDLRGLVLADDGGEDVTITESVVVPPGAYAALGAVTGDGRTGDPVVWSYPGGQFRLANSSDEVILLSGDTVVDAVRYDESWPVEAGVAMELDAESLDAAANDDPARWCTAVGVPQPDAGFPDLGSPGAPNRRCLLGDGPPPNDFCADAELLAAGEEVRVRGSTRGASERIPGFTSDSPAVFYRFEVGGIMAVTFTATAEGSTWSPFLSVLRGPCEDLDEVASLDFEAESATAELVVDRIEAGTYTVVVSGMGPDDFGRFALRVALHSVPFCGDDACDAATESWRTCLADCERPGPAPANDRCEDAAPLPAHDRQRVAGDTSLALQDLGGAFARRGPDVFYRFDLATAAAVTIRMEASPRWDTYLVLLSGGCDALESVGSNDDAEGAEHVSALEQGRLEPGPYVVAATGAGAEDLGAFSLRLDFATPWWCGDGACRNGREDWQTCPDDCEVPAPPNDRCAAAIAVPTAGERRFEGTTTGAAHDLDVVGGGAPDVFYRFQLDQPASVSLRLAPGSAWDVRLGLAGGGCDAPELVAEDRAWGGSTATLGRGKLEPGPYLVVVAGGSASEAGPYTLTATFAAPEAMCDDDVCDDELGEDWRSCPDDCEPACANLLGRGSRSGDTRGEAHDYAPHRSQSPDVFYAFYLEERSAVALLLEGEGRWDTWLYLLRGRCGDLAEVARDDDFGRSQAGKSQILQPDLAPGSYFVVVTGYDGDDAGRYDLEAAFGDPVSCGDGVCNVRFAEWRSCRGDCCAGAARPVVGDLAVNEVLLDPGETDVNEDGEASPRGDEFVEIVNRSGRRLDLAGVSVRVRDNGQFRTPHTFEDLCLQPGSGVVVFGSPNEPTLVEPLAVFLGSQVPLDLPDGGTTVQLRSGAGQGLDEAVLAAQPGADPWARSPDGSGDFVPHPYPENVPPSFCIGSCPPDLSPGRCSTGESFPTCLPGAGD